MSHSYLKPLLLAAFIACSTFSYANSESSLSKEITAFANNQQDLWSRIRQGYGIPDLDNSLVSSQLNWYSSRSAYILRTTERASLYLYHVVEELEKRGMPTELALLPFIESAFNPQALSSAKASGMWQFIPSTGRDFNLKQNMFQDERRGVLESTDAALSYLQKLHNMFGDWQLALAAYNWGEGSVQRAIKKQEAAGLPVDYQSMSYLMPKETQNYVPKLQAVKNIIGDPGQFNIELPEVDNEPYFVAVDNTRDMDVQIAAQLAELSVAEFKKLNPQFNRPVITGDVEILLPADNLEIFQTNLNKWEGPLSSWTAYSVRKNERVESIAHRFGAPVNVIKEINQIPRNMLVKAGSTLLIPKTEHTKDSDIAQYVVDNASLVLARDYGNKAFRKNRILARNKNSLARRAKHYKAYKVAASSGRMPVKKKVGSLLAGHILTRNATKKLKPKSALMIKKTKKASVAQFKAKQQSY